MGQPNDIEITQYLIESWYEDTWLPAWQGVTIGILKRALSERMTNHRVELYNHSDACYRDMYAGSNAPCSCGLDVALAVREEMMEDV